MQPEETRQLARAAVTAGETAAIPSKSLVPQAHGGALLAGGQAGNRGGGRQKESLRQRMRDMLGETLSAMGQALSGERSAASAGKAILNDPRVCSLDPHVRAVIEAVCRDHLTATLSAREIGQFHETLARYGVGALQEVEHTKNETRYVIRYPVAQEAVIAGTPVVDVPAPHAMRVLNDGAASVAGTDR
jgi:hypothetical protein